MDVFKGSSLVFLGYVHLVTPTFSLTSLSQKLLSENASCYPLPHRVIISLPWHIHTNYERDKQVFVILSSTFPLERLE